MIAALLMAATMPSADVDFDTHIVPVLIKAGCNSGACHGSAAGRGGFRLSLFGSDPAADHNSIVHELKGRRVNQAQPPESLIVLKATGQIKHGGGTRIDQDDVGARRLLSWIQAGAKRSSSPRSVTNLEIAPRQHVFTKAGEQIRLSAKATFNDETNEDVTAWTVFTADDPASIQVNDASLTVIRPGQHQVAARFLDRIVSIRLTLPFGEQPIEAEKGRANFIDDEINATLQALRLPASPPCDDSAFLRRITLDLTGRLPTVGDLAQFEADARPDKRSQLVDRLLDSVEFIDYWTFQLNQLVGNRPLPNEKAGAIALQQWFREQLRERRGFDAMVRDLLTAVGDSHQSGPAWFWRLSPDARGQAEAIGQSFLGIRLQCANCHNHPFDRWTQDDYHGLAALLAKVERGRFVRNSTRGEVTHPRDGEPALPRFPGVNVQQEKPRESLAKWMTARDNPLFAKAIVNRLWKSMFGRGLVDPVDDLRVSNSASHPELLDRLTADFMEHGCDIRRTLRLIAGSAAYSRGGKSLPGQRGDERFYARSHDRPVPAEVLLDAWSDITGVPTVFAGQPAETRAIALVDPATPSTTLDLLGRCSRASACNSDERGGGLPAVLHRINGDAVNSKIKSPNGRLHRMIAEGRSDTEIVTEFVIRSFGRRPTQAELKLMTAVQGDRTAWLEDVVWALLNNRECTTNH